MHVQPQITSLWNLFQLFMLQMTEMLKIGAHTHMVFLKSNPIWYYFKNSEWRTTEKKQHFNKISVCMITFILLFIPKADWKVIKLPVSGQDLEDRLISRVGHPLLSVSALAPDTSADSATEPLLLDEGSTRSTAWTPYWSCSLLPRGRCLSNAWHLFWFFLTLLCFSFTRV